MDGKNSSNTIFLIGLISVAAFFVLYSVISHSKIVSTQNNTEQKNNPDKTITVGINPITQDNITFQDSIQNIGNTINSPGMFHGKKTSGTWEVVTLSETNEGNQTIDVEPSKFQLVDQQGRSFDPSAWYYCGDTMEHTYYSPLDIAVLKPDIACNTGILFETSKDSTSFTVKIDYTLFNPN